MKTFTYSWAWRHRILVRTSLTWLLISFVLILTRGIDETLENPSTLIMTCSVFAILNILSIKYEKDTVLEVRLLGEVCKIRTYDGRYQEFLLSDIQSKTRVTSEHGFRGYSLEQICIKINGISPIFISINIRDFDILCEALEIEDFKKLTINKNIA